MHHRLLCAALGACLAVAACTGDGDAPTDASPGGAPVETGRSPTPSPVRGEATVVVTSTHPGPIVFHDQPAPPGDEAAIAAAVERVTGWLDRHLTDLQSGGGGLLSDVAAPGLLDGAPPELTASVTTRLTGPERPVRTALYHVVVAQEGHPQFLRVTALVETDTGTITRTGFVFGPADPLVLLAAGSDDRETAGVAPPPPGSPQPEATGP